MQRGGISANTGGNHRGRYGNLFYQKEYGVFVENINDFIGFSLNVK